MNGTSESNGRTNPRLNEIQVQTKQWTWTFEGTPIKINLVEYLPNGSSPTKTLVMLPTISDVSTTEEWHAVAERLQSKSSTSYRIVCVDFPGLGLSDRPGIDYTADLYEKFLVDIISEKDGPICPSSGLNCSTQSKGNDFLCVSFVDKTCSKPLRR